MLENPSVGKPVVDSIEESVIKVDCDHPVEVKYRDEIIHNTTPSC